MFYPLDHRPQQILDKRLADLSLHPQISYIDAKKSLNIFLKQLKW